MCLVFVGKLAEPMQILLVLFRNIKLLYIYTFFFYLTDKNLSLNRGMALVFSPNDKLHLIWWHLGNSGFFLITKIKFCMDNVYKLAFISIRVRLKRCRWGLRIEIPIGGDVTGFRYRLWMTAGKQSCRSPNLDRFCD